MLLQIDVSVKASTTEGVALTKYTAANSGRGSNRRAFLPHTLHRFFDAFLPVRCRES